MDDGTYQRIDGRPAVRFERVYPHSIETTWLAVTTPERMERWFPSSIEFEPRVDGSIRFFGDPYAPDSSGVVLEFNPPHVFAFSWGDNELRFELDETSEGQTRFVLIDFLSAENEAARNAAGWDICLVDLDSTIAGSDARTAEGLAHWRTRYDTYVAAGVPSGAPSPE